ncbi:MAG: putative sulfate/molybdate transporter [Thalassobaculum sp.]|uniref:putative sulfate/molybdate transporter n=1 Tax=Thalassobaculum sp. TaxID=2022740 RepID=UPI0032EF4C86
MLIWEATGERFVFNLREVSGALGDLGTLLPLTLGILAVSGHAPTPVLLGFAAFYVVTALVYRLPIPVQPMKAVAAVILTAGVPVAGVAASGVMIGAVLLLLGATGWIDRVARSVPRSVLAGLQLGLGLALGLFAARLIGHAPATGLAILGLLIGLQFAPRLPAAIIALAAAILLGWAIGDPGLGVVGDPVEGFALPAWPSAADLATSFTVLTLPQLSLTLSNAVLLTALLAGDYFGTKAEHVTPARLSVTSGLANLLLVPFGALPMCHGAGGLAAHHRFGARSGTAPLLLGLALAALALAPGRIAVDLLSAVPVAGLGALLLVAAAELALSRRLFDGKPSCLPVIAATAGVTLWIDPFWGLLAGCGAELVRVAVLRRLRPRGQPE